MKENETHYYTRFTLQQRYLHWILAGTFLGLSFTGFQLRFSSTSWVQTVAHAVGGFSAILFFHKFCAVLLSIAFLAHVAELVYRIGYKREFWMLWGPNSMVPRLKDLQDLIGNLKWFVHLGPKPKIDRYAYWDKLDYWGVFWGMAIIGFSGYAMWFSAFFSRFLPGSMLNVALVIHGEEAILATGWIFLVHFFNTHLRPGNFPMDLTIFTGRLSEHHLKTEHPEEYDRLVKSGELQTLVAEPPQRWLNNFGRVVGFTAVAAGVIMLVFMTIAFVRS